MNLGIPTAGMAQGAQAARAAGPAPQPLQISPQVTEALQKIAQNMGAQGGLGMGALGGPIDKNSPEYRQAMLMELAKTGPMGAAGSVMQQMADAQNQKAQQAAWAPTVKFGGGQ